MIKRDWLKKSRLYNTDIMPRSACLIIDPVMVDNYIFI